MAKTFLEFDAGEFFSKINKDFAKRVKKEIIPQIVDTIKKGRSPVRGQNFPSYSDGYTKQIQRGRYSQYGKKTRPVNLTLSGKMLRAFKVRPLLRGGVTIYNSNRLAKYHNDEGAGRGRVIRKMLPTSGSEKFKTNIQKNINLQLEKAIAKQIRK